MAANDTENDIDSPSARASSAAAASPPHTQSSLPSAGAQGGASRSSSDTPQPPLQPPKRRLRIAMCCDFFYPRLGGVEMHIWSLSQCLLRQGHKVIILTHAVNDASPSGSSKKLPRQRSGVRWMTNGLKVYYMPMTVMVDNVTYPTFFANFALFRTILLRERIEIVHGHQATSALMHECLVQAKTMGFLRTVYTDHSLFGFADAASVHLNKIMKFSLSTVDHAISVSHTCKENLVLRASISPDIVSTIPNAVDATKFTPPTAAELLLQPGRTPSGAKQTINVVIISRLVYRKGIDLVGRAIQIVCSQCDHVNFIIGGDGPKRLLLEEMREKHRLHDRVLLYGAVPHSKVREVLCQGHIFLNSSLTESFCIAILEAAACGLFVVSTCVGGVPEVLPPDMIKFAKEITPEALADAVLEAIPLVAQVNRAEFHDRVADMYNWHAVAARTEKVYAKVMDLPESSLLHRLQLYHGLGPIAGILACLIVAVLQLYLCVLDLWKPVDEIEAALEWKPRGREQTIADESGDETTPLAMD
ncbi:Phosphatidylinositol n-acetylglucosaminyltransferase gpi3 subunit, partial [Globisporangium splendens]